MSYGIQSSIISAGADIGGSGAANQVAFFTGTNIISSSANLGWDGTTLSLGSGRAILLPAGSAAAPSLGVGNANTGFYYGAGGAGVAGQLFFTVGGINAGVVQGVASGPVWGWILGTDTQLANVYVSGQLLVMNAGAQQVGIGASCTIGNGAIDGVAIFTGDTTSNGNSQGGNVLLYGHTHATKADRTEFYQNGSLSMWSTNAGVWTIGKTGNITNHTTIGGVTVTRTDAIADHNGLILTAGTATGTVRHYFKNSTGTRTFEFDGTFSGGTENLNLQSDTSAIAVFKRNGDMTLGNNSNSVVTATGSVALTGGSVSFGTSGQGITGSTTNDSANAGVVGEFIQTRTTSFTNVPGSSGNWSDLGSVALTAGDWDVSCMVNASLNSSVMTSMDVGISTTTGNSATGLQEGDNWAESAALPVGSVHQSVAVPAYRMSLSGNTTVYLKGKFGYSVATPQYVSRISARRMR